MKTKLALVVFILIGFAQAMAQNYTFKVLVNKGKNEVKAGKDWQTIKVGSSLNSADELKVAENSYIGLVHVSGKPLEVKQAGKYKVADLAAKVSGGANVLNKYADFILSSNTQKANGLQATGAVHRGSIIPLYLPSATQNPAIYNDVIIINWDAEKIPGPYTVKFKSLFDEELAKLDANESSLRIDLSDPSFTNEDNILVTVESKTDKNKVSEKYTLKRLSKADKARIKNALSEISAQTEDNTAINKLILAGFFEQNSLLIDAATALQEAIKLAPDVQMYRDLYNDFLIRNKLKDKPLNSK
ncbi:hypothetical protein [Ohtaekwangia koreensis]|uniref:Tetratricopeptide repeat-containing protein n=1 Tax=Ohtaekwangia koreensis TaxID=688867 RepID=A0A1T5IMP4_9BACT|nr:hypothetical protein [Ohtaekwangia koreensis]SKC40233.1 hypothetical protein SAMN05660236_0166 [Ohtaekwangia koreensis]